jgi:hypothetical protein
VFEILGAISPLTQLVKGFDGLGEGRD